MNARIPLLPVGMAILLAGCSLAPKYTRPEPPVPADWPKGPAYLDAGTATGAPAASALGWRGFFADPKLQTIIGMALNHNRDLRLAALNVERARGLYGIQRAERFPILEAVGSGRKERVPESLSEGNGGAVTVERYEVNVSVSSWEIDFFGRLRSLKDRALEEYLATEEARRSARILIVSDVANAYLVLAADRESLRLSESTLETQRAVYDLVRRRYELGLSSELDLRRAQTSADAARADVARYMQLAAQDENALDLLAGAKVPRELLPEGLESIRPPEEISAGLPSEVLLGRPDILAAEHRLKGVNANIGAARAAFFPRISLTAAFGTASGDLSGLFGSGTRAWSFSPEAVLPIFDARTWPALAVSKVDREIAVAQYERAIQTAFREVADALAVRGTVGRRISAQQSLVDASARTYHLSTVRFEKGIDDYFGVLDAQRSLYAAQHALIAVRLAGVASQVRLYAVLGGGGE
ncbi:MAG TPA: efflux transporter outer membrane subunit [Candidatus Deferrimicrobiaceae bacterium]|nr:efflux transporter outer membrane subunit [Candidatus Deferrimicrobiaceae bacterium]